MASSLDSDAVLVPMPDSLIGTVSTLSVFRLADLVIIHLLSRLHGRSSSRLQPTRRGERFLHDSAGFCQLLLRIASALATSGTAQENVRPSPTNNRDSATLFPVFRPLRVRTSAADRTAVSV